MLHSLQTSACALLTLRVVKYARLLFALLVFNTLLGCAPFGPGGLHAGDDEAAVLDEMGQPTAVHTLPASAVPAVKRLEFWRGPFARATFMVDLDQTNRVLHIQQVLNTANFERIRPLQWTQADIRREFGPPVETGRVYNGDVTWTYRYRDVWDLMYHVYFNAQGQVTRAHQGPDDWLECRHSVRC